MTDHWCTYCQGVNAHNCQFNPNLPRMEVYTTNTTAAQPKTRPLRAEQVYEICRRTLPKTAAGLSFVPEWALPLARAIEAAHGIGEQP